MKYGANCKTASYFLLLTVCQMLIATDLPHPGGI
jgi:hypothetical protein